MNFNRVYLILNQVDSIVDEQQAELSKITLQQLKMVLEELPALIRTDDINAVKRGISCLKETPLFVCQAWH